jgi:hypothetical protein
VLGVDLGAFKLWVVIDLKLEEAFGFLHIALCEIGLSQVAPAETQRDVGELSSLSGMQWLDDSPGVIGALGGPAPATA